MKTRTTILRVGFALAAFQAAAAWANGIAGIAYEGDGCPAGTVSVSISDDRQDATLIFDRFVATIGPGVDLEDDARSCELTVTLAGSEGFTAEVQSRGFVQLGEDLDAVAHQHVIPARHGLAQAHFNGPLVKDYLVADQIAVRPQSRGPRSFRIRLEVALDGDAGRGQMTIDSFDISID